MEVIGVPSEEIINRGSRSHKFFDGYKPKVIPNSKGKLRTAGAKTINKKLKNC